MKAIEIVNLSKYYGKKMGIKDVSLTIEEGDFFGFVGPNGAGKSTTIRTLLGLIFKTSGEAYIFSEDIEKDHLSILKKVGYLSSDVSYYDGKKAIDIIRYSASLRKVDCEKRMFELANRLDLDLNKKVNDMSLGNKKKVGIICALQHNPALLILDEPTSGLDPLIQKEFFSILKEYNENKTTIFLSSHNLSEVQRYCNKAAIIKDGVIIACDYVEKLLDSKSKRVIVHTSDIKTLTDSLNENVHKVEVSNGSINFLYNGNVNDLLKTLSKIDVSDIQIIEPDLEEVFLHYYEKERDGQ